MSSNQNNSRKLITALASVIVLAAGCGRTNPQNANVKQARKPPDQPVAKSERLGDELFAKLIANSWTNYNSDSLQAEGYILHISFDGKYKFQFLSDYDTQPEAGHWNLDYRRDQWFLIFDNGRRSPIRFDEKGQLHLGNAVYWVDKPTPFAGKATRQALPKISLQPEQVELKKRLTATAWKKANDMDVYRLPTRLELRDDWSYQTVYRGGECKTAGEWGFAFENEKLQFAGWSPRTKCDTRGEGAEHLGGLFAHDGQLLVNGTLYVPESQVLDHAIVWNICGYSNVVRTELRYKMPLQANKPNLLELVFHLHPSQSSVVLQRFSLARKYNDKYRISKSKLSSQDEIAGVDLQGHILKPGEKYRISLPAVFPEAGRQHIYFNTFMYGTTQTWDTQAARSVTVK